MERELRANQPDGMWRKRARWFAEHGCRQRRASTVYHKPFWQTGVTGVPQVTHRYQPDVSLFASPGFNNTGYIVCQQDRNTTGLPACDLNTNFGYLDFHIFGGTSASAPAFAGVIALVNQYQAAHGGIEPQGNANIILYALAKKAVRAAHQVLLKVPIAFLTT